MIFPTFIALLATATSSLAAGPTAPTGLLTNGIENPQAIDVAPPAFSWVMNDPDRGETQTAWQVVVSSDASVLWDSGKINSALSSSVPYAGPALAPATRYKWRVKLWDKDDNKSPFSADATFDTGLSKSDWTASFIWDGTPNENNFAFFRKGFTLSKPVKLAKVFTSAHNDAILHLNGTPLGFGPARSNPTTYGQYTAYDVTSQLVNGTNAFAALAHWHGVWNDSGTNASPAFLLECRITFTDETTLIVKSDGTWKTQASTPFIEDSPTYFGLYGGVKNRAAIRYDARNEIPGWTTAAFDDSSWPAAAVVDRSTYQLFAQRVADQIEDEELAPVSVLQYGNDWVADFGKCISGWPQITLRDQAPGSVIRINYFQMADNSGGAGWDEYTCKGGTETWRANFGRHTSFKTLRISGITGTLTSANLRGIVAHTKAAVAGSFTCSSPLLNDIFGMSERSARQNVQQGIISVDANREQSPWTADSYNIGIGLLYNHRNTLVLDKILRDYAGEQMPDGRFWACSPTPIYEIPEWSMHWPLMLWQQYLFTGDTKLLRDLWPNLVKWMTWAESNTQSTGLLDAPGWRVADYAGGIMENDGQNIALNAFYFGNLRVARDVATILGHSTEATAYHNRATTLKTAINTHLFDGTSYLTKVGGGQRIALGTAYSLRFGLVPDHQHAQVTAWLRKQPAHLGGYGGYTYYHGAYEAGGLGDLIVSDLIRYQFMLAGNRTIWESFGRPSPDNETNHAWTAYPAELFPRYIAGIAPTGPAFSTFSIKPETRGLTFAEATVPGIRGDIHTRWEKVSATELRLTSAIPANTTALVHIPLESMKDVTIKEGETVVWTNGASSNNPPGITFDGADSRYVRFTVGSGTFTFTATGTAIALPPLTVICDNDKPAVTLSGSWTNNSTNEGEQRYELSVEQAAAGDGSSTAIFRPNLPTGGRYKIFARWTSHPNRATNAPFTIHHNNGQDTVRVNQEQDGGKWILLGEYDFASGTAGHVLLTNDANEWIVADAVAFSPVAVPLAQGASIRLLEDDFNSAGNTFNANVHAESLNEKTTTVHVDPSREIGRFQGMGCGAIFYEGHITSLSKRGLHDAQKSLYDDMFAKVNTKFLQLMIRHDHEPTNDNMDPWNPEFKDEGFAYARETLAICRAALKRRPDMEFHATLYTPPAWMKTNNDITAGGESRATLKDGMDLELAEYCWAFLDFMRRNGICIHGLSIANEPDWPHTQPGYCLGPERNASLTASVGDYLDEMARRHPETPAPQIIGPNTLSAVGAADDYLPPLIDKAGWHLDVVGSHDYDRRGDRWKNLMARAGGRPVWCTEWCVNGHDDSPGLIRSMSEYWLAMTEAFNQGVNGWMAYDWVYPPRPGGEALIHVDWGKEYRLTKIYHGFRQWCDPLTPGMKTVATRLVGSAATGIGQPGVKACAFLSEDDRRLVLHLANVQDITANISIDVPAPWGDRPVRLLVTSSQEDMKGSTFLKSPPASHEMPARSVFTLVWDR